MDALAQRFQGLSDFLPPRAFEAVLPYFRQYPIALTITRERKTRLGDYRSPAKGEKEHLISVNGNLNPYAFLVTLIHEIAHLLVYEKHRRAVKSHGPEWKLLFGVLLVHFADAGLFPKALEKVIRTSAQNPASATFRDVALSKALSQFDEKNADEILAGDLAEGTAFRAPDGQVYQMTERRRSRIKCKRISDGKEFLLPFAAAVEKVKIAS